MKNIKDKSIVFQGNGCGGVYLGGNARTYMGVSCDKYVLPKSLTPVFLELNYNCNTPFNIGVVAYDPSNVILSQNAFLTITPNDGWNKIYVNLSEEVSNHPSAVKYGVFFSMIKNQTNSLSYFYVDNLKLVTK